MIDCSRIIAAGDVDQAISLGKVKKVFLKCSPKGAGTSVEVASGRAKDRYYFENEHNVIWVKFKTPKAGELLLTIKPKNPKNDYDFLLFKALNESSIQQIKTRKLKPVRSNLSRNNEDIKGVTGLSFNASQTNVYSGPQSEFSKPLNVEKDETYYLVLDNVYEDGQGAIIDFNYYATKKISGFVTNETKDKKLNAEVSWEDAETGEILTTTKADGKTGYFEMEVPFVINNPDKMYILAIDAEEYFFEEKMMTAVDLKKLTPEPLHLVLPKLKKGKRLKISNIHFKGGQPTFIPSAKPSLKRLLKLMRKNKTLTILVEGHTNGCNNAAVNSQILSERRALPVKKYLFDNEIDETRIKTIGHGCTKMLFPTTGTAEQQQLNRRVEILILEY